ncbi:hypothetical protein [Stieleria varia]|uniref:Uncharacterized protein n=1 Tax=Stieleria varia TaxID=2528005 RepID=A0A5C6ATY9_9BACT|nr:hypothetical protein [Stieleria varia]TWU02891.1 hypothetical protein Pla52n_39790 [Stieleria varia]
MNVYELSYFADDPRFSGFEFPEDAPSLISRESITRDFDPELHGKLDWKPVSLAKVWVPQPVVGGVQPYNDYPRVGMLPAFSRRAVEALRVELEANGEILPIQSKVGEYFVYNVLTKSLALDVDKSEITFGPPNSSKETAFMVDRFEFDETRLAEHAIFRIREYPQVVLVTEEFKRKADQAQLNGLNFVLVSPIPAGQNWEDRETARWRARRKSVEPLRGQCLTIVLPTAKRKATEAEKVAARRVLHSLESVLADHIKSMDHGFIGSVDETSERKSELLLYVTCPDVEVLIEKLRPWIVEIDWPKPVRLEKLHGNRFDVHAEWEPVE